MEVFEIFESLSLSISLYLFLYLVVVARKISMDILTQQAGGCVSSIGL